MASAADRGFFVAADAVPRLLEEDGTPTREVILHVARLLEAEPSVRGCSAHLLVVGRKGPQTA